MRPHNATFAFRSISDAPIAQVGDRHCSRVARLIAVRWHPPHSPGHRHAKDCRKLPVRRSALLLLGRARADGRMSLPRPTMRFAAVHRSRRVRAMPFVKAPTLDDSSWIQPNLHIWCDSAQPWDTIPAHAACVAQNPPASRDPPQRMPLVRSPVPGMTVPIAA